MTTRQHMERQICRPCMIPWWCLTPEEMRNWPPPTQAQKDRLLVVWEEIMADSRRRVESGEKPPKIRSGYNLLMCE